MVRIDLLAIGCCAAALAHAQAPSLCAAVSAADLEAVLKQKVTSMQPLKHTRGCRYLTANGAVTLNFLNTAGDAKGEYEGHKRLQSSGGKAQAIAGVGDEAVLGMVLVAREGDRVLMVD